MNDSQPTGAINDSKPADLTLGTTVLLPPVIWSGSSRATDYRLARRNGETVLQACYTEYGHHIGTGHTVGCRNEWRDIPTVELPT